MASLFNRPQGEMNGCFYNDVTQEAFGEIIMPSHARIQETQSRGTGEVQMGDRWLHVTADPILSERGSVVGTVYVLADITTIKAAAIRQRAFQRDMLSIAIEGRLRLSDSPADLPPPLSPIGDIISLAPETLRTLRHRTLEMTATQNFSQERCLDLETAVGEAAMNAVIHAGGGQALLYADLDALGTGTIQVWIRDQGKGITTESLHRATLERGYSTAGSLGHGFWLMLKTCDRIWLLTGPSGTTIVLEEDREAPEPFWLDRPSSVPEPALTEGAF